MIYLERDHLKYFNLMDSESDIRLGYICHHGCYDSDEIGIEFLSNARGRGYGTILIEMYKHFRNRIYARTRPDNLACNRLLQKAGFKQVKTCESYVHYIWTR